VVSRYIVDFGTMRQHAGDFFHDCHVFFWEIFFRKLPDVDDVAVEDEFFWSDTFEVANKFGGVTAVSSKVYVRNDERFNFSSLVVSHGSDSQFSILNSEFGIRNSEFGIRNLNSAVNFEAFVYRNLKASLDLRYYILFQKVVFCIVHSRE
jgi:hypothetical protein